MKLNKTNILESLIANMIFAVIAWIYFVGKTNNE